MNHWVKSKKAPVNPINKNDNKCFQYAATVALNYEKIGKNPERITKNMHFISKYNWERINYLPKKMTRKNLKKNNLTIALNVLYEIKKK